MMNSDIDNITYMDEEFNYTPFGRLRISVCR